MQKLQANILKILFLFFLLLSRVVNAQNFQEHLKKADLLFQQKKYHEAMQAYDSLFARRLYSPAMLAKMAFVEEGRGNVAACLYYLSKINEHAPSERVNKKIAEMTEKYGVKGYEENFSFKPWLLKNEWIVLYGVAACSMLVFFVVGMMNKKWMLVAGFVLLLGAGLSLYVVRTCERFDNGIVRQVVYARTEPAAAASVSAMIEQGNRLFIVDQTDKWCKTNWQGKIVYINQSDLFRWK